VTLPKNTYDRSEKKDKKLVDEIVNPIAAQYNPLPAITGMQIVL